MRAGQYIRLYVKRTLLLREMLSFSEATGTAVAYLYWNMRALYGI